MATSGARKTSKHELWRPQRGGGFLKKTVSTLATVVGVATLALVGFTLLASIPDIRRYIKISMM
jgi:hypothetical protein